ncbi:MAG: hypothetical protein EOM14_12275, partial [Clostridia bacterium]|nr:hypothetical protein [Clostridia bacterium]
MCRWGMSGHVEIGRDLAYNNMRNKRWETAMTETLKSARMRLCAASILDIEKTFECGQCFRWNADEYGAYNGVAYGRAARVWAEDGAVYIDASEDERSFWSEYFDLETDYEEARRSVDTGEYLSQCAEFGKGIRILKQEPWEALCSFIISQCNNIPRIKSITEKLCFMFGEPIRHDGVIRYAFPSAERIAALVEH